MKKFFMLFVGAVLFFGFSAAQDTACTMEYMPICGQPPMPSCPSGMACAQVMPQPVTYGNDCMRRASQADLLYSGECQAVIVPSEPAACTKEYMPVCGSKQVQCFAAPCNPIQQTYSNACEMKNDNASLLYNGACAEVDLSTCTSYFDGCNTCSVKNGELNACTEMACVGEQKAPRCLQYVDEVRDGDTVIVSKDLMQHIQSVVSRVLAPWATLVTKSEMYQGLINVVDDKIATIKYEMMVSRYTPEGYKAVIRQLSILQYLQYVLRNLQAIL